MPRVLLVEDNKMAQKMFIVTFEHLNCQIDIAGTGEQALELFAANTYDLVFMDLGLPGISGYQTTQQIRQQPGTKKFVPIIALTAHSDLKSRQLSMEAGVDDFVVKPLSKEKATEIMSNYVLQGIKSM